MDKVIIDGVDVSECPSMRLIKNETICQGGNTKIFKDYSYVCCENSNCYYKQLQRARAEIEQLKKQIEYDSRYNDMQAEIDCGEKIISELKAENKDLKARKDKYYKMTLDYEIQISDLVQENEKLKEENQQQKLELITQLRDFSTSKLFSEKEIVAYRQCLKEIKEYIGTCCHRFSENYKDLCYGCEYDKELCDYSIILAKISGVME